MERPKVRFSQTIENVIEQKRKELVNSNNKGKIKVKSIVPTNFPVKVLENGKRILIKGQKSINYDSEVNKVKGFEANCKDYNINEKIESNNSASAIPIYVSEACDTPINLRELSTTTSESETLTDEDFLESQYHQEEEIKRINEAFEMQKCTDKSQIAIIDHAIDDSLCASKNTNEVSNYNKNVSKILNSGQVEGTIPCITCDDSDENNDVEIIQIIKPSAKLKHSHQNRKSIFVNKNETTERGNKENYSKTIEVNKTQKELPISNRAKVLKDATNVCSKMPKSIPTKKITKGQKKVDLMPCAKFKLASLSKNKTMENLSKTQVKKSTVFHVAGNHRNISVQPETSHKKYNDTTESNLTEDIKRQNIISKDLLSRPEYNSTICVMKKLKEIEKEKVVTNFEDLPSTYRNLIYGKVSAALDFAPYESVYKDLINLSIDDDRLPARLMRSKDPEPRNKDVVPKLSDFYTPKYTEQYFVIANPTPPNPVNVNSLNAFTISNKICTWKKCRDIF